MDTTVLEEQYELHAINDLTTFQVTCVSETIGFLNKYIRESPNVKQYLPDTITLQFDSVIIKISYDKEIKMYEVI